MEITSFQNLKHGFRKMTGKAEANRASVEKVGTKASKQTTDFLNHSSPFPVPKGQNHTQ